MPKLCANGCTVHFGPTTVNVSKDGKVILTGTKDSTRNLYMVPLHDDTVPTPQKWPPSVPSATAGNAYELTSAMQQLAFIHASAGYPTRSTFLRAICRNSFIGWLLLTL